MPRKAKTPAAKITTCAPKMGAAPRSSAKEANKIPTIWVPNWAALTCITVRWTRPPATWLSSASLAGVMNAWAQPITAA